MKFAAGFVLVLAVLGCATLAHADGINIAAGDYVRLYNGVGDSPGGEFNGYVQKLSGSTWVDSTVSWFSFCVEVDEYFSYGELLRVKAVSDTAQRGGSNTNSGDELSFETAWLYTEFCNGTLAGLNAAGTAIDATDDEYTDKHARNATHLQQAIWYLEGESLGVNNYYVTLAQNAVLAGWNTIGNVRILNLERYSGGSWGYAQDQLVMLPVPEPGTLLLVGLGVVAAGAHRRRRRSVSGTAA